jgi:hypothetical protein
LPNPPRRPPFNDLREALLRYRSLFDELLRPEDNGAAGNGAAGNGAAGNGAAGNGAADGTIGQAQPAGAGPADPDPYYDDQRIGRREGR